MQNDRYDIGMIGLGVMGRNFVLNMAEKGFRVAGYDKNTEQQKALTVEAGDLPAKAFTNLEDMVNALSSPKKIMLLVPAGKIVDAVIAGLVPLLEKGDIIIDGGNSHFTDTTIREQQLLEKGIYFLGTGISGGEEGARHGPAIMPGGNEEAYQYVRPVFERTAAIVQDEPCVTFVGKGSAGHYVKMVHNGIEYGLMQLISECYALLKHIHGADNDELHEIFSAWNKTELNSFLIEITAQIFKAKDGDEDYLIDKIKDSASAKGTGKWTSQSAMDLQEPVPVIDTAVWMRDLSDQLELRTFFSSQVKKAIEEKQTPSEEFVDTLQRALHAAFILTYAQGFALLSKASDEYKYDILIHEICKIWRGGCIIRSALLETFMQIYGAEAKTSGILRDDDMYALLQKLQNDMRSVIKAGIDARIPVAAFSAALAYFDTLQTPQLATNLIQAQRDYFGAHTFQRIDKEGIFHNKWV